MVIYNGKVHNFIDYSLWVNRSTCIGADYINSISCNYRLPNKEKKNIKDEYDRLGKKS